MRATGPVTSVLQSSAFLQTVEARRAYRELIVTTPGLGESIGGAILYDETIRQQKSDGTPFVKVLIAAGIIPGIKVDKGAKELAGHPGEKVTEGLDGLRDRLQEYFQMGARFAKWRAVIAIGEGFPSWGCIEANAHALARYAALCQEAGLVPVVEPEVIMDGEHTLEQCCEVTRQNPANCIQRVVCATGHAGRNDPEAEHGASRNGLHDPADIGRGSRRHRELLPASCARCCSGDCVPVRRPIRGIGSARLNAMNVRFKSRLPWALAFSFARAIQQPALEIWKGQEANVSAGTAGFVSPRPLQSVCAPRRILPGDGDEMTGSKHNPEGNSGDKGEPDPGPYWRRMHRDWRFWVGAVFMAAALAVYVLSGDLAWVPNGHRQPAMPAPAAN